METQGVAAWLIRRNRTGPLLPVDPKVRQKTVGRWMSSAQRDDDQLWIDNHHRIRELLSRLKAISEQALEADPLWKR